MRHPFKTQFDAILNLFTSFGYFEEEEINIKVLKNLKSGLKKNGVLVIDFMNVNYVKEHLIEEEIITKGNIEFHIKRHIKDDFIIKEIRFYADGKDHFFKERVKYLPLATLKRFIKKANLKLKHTFGEYSLTAFDIKKSSRLILIVE